MRADLNLQHDMEMMAKKGRLVVVGALGHVQINPRLLMGPEFQIRAVGCYGFTACSNFESKNRIHSAQVEGHRLRQYHDSQAMSHSL